MAHDRDFDQVWLAERIRKIVLEAALESPGNITNGPSQTSEFHPARSTCLGESRIPPDRSTNQD
jgi:hypothetical protein